MKYMIAFILMFFMVPFVYAQDIIERNNTVIIRKDLGGSLSEYMIKYKGMQNRATKIAIDGECDSACTLFLGFVPLQAICVTANAKLGFHRSTRAEGTTIFLMNYPFPILLWLMDVGLTEDIKYMPDGMIQSLFQQCPDALINPPASEKVE